MEIHLNWHYDQRVFLMQKKMTPRSSIRVVFFFYSSFKLRWYSRKCLPFYKSIAWMLRPLGCHRNMECWPAQIESLTLRVGNTPTEQELWWSQLDESVLAQVSWYTWASIKCTWLNSMLAWPISLVYKQSKCLNVKTTNFYGKMLKIRLKQVLLFYNWFF